MAEVFSPASASSFVSRTLHCPNEHAFVDFLEQYLLAGPVGRDALFVALIKHVTTTGYDPARGAPPPARSAPAEALPAGHVGLAEMAATGISDAAAVGTGPAGRDVSGSTPSAGHSGTRWVV